MDNVPVVNTIDVVGNGGGCVSASQGGNKGGDEVFGGGHAEVLRGLSDVAERVEDK